MIKLIAGLKGSGKTKTLIQMTNDAGSTSKGAVVCIEKGDKLLHEIKYTVRLVNVEKFDITSAQSLYGFIAGICASNHDISDIFIDSALKICNNDIAMFEIFVDAIRDFIKSNQLNINVIMTASVDQTSLTPGLIKYL